LLNDIAKEYVGLEKAMHELISKWPNKFEFQKVFTEFFVGEYC
jgi:hypothetical protein